MRWGYEVGFIEMNKEAASVCEEALVTTFEATVVCRENFVV